MPPYFDIAHFDQAAAILNRYPTVAFVTCINSIGNALVIDTESESVVIKPKDGFGGIGGDYVLPTALANVNAFYRRCPEKLVIGCGGVKTGEHDFHALARGSLAGSGRHGAAGRRPGDFSLASTKNSSPFWHAKVTQASKQSVAS